jgi:Icc-related predicted phosphoesterase
LAAVLLALLAMPSAAQQDTGNGSLFFNQPYLQNPTDGGMTIMWQTTGPALCQVEYGTDTLHLQTARHIVDGEVVCYTTDHKVRLENLEPGRRYFYRVRAKEILDYQAYSKKFGREEQTAFHSFCLPSMDTKDFTAVIFNDLHNNVPVFKAVLAQVRDVKPDFYVFNGDCFDAPTHLKGDVRLLGTYNEGIDAADIPVIYLRGNHEVRGPYSIAMQEYFDRIGTHPYGAFNWGTTRFVMLDCGEDKPDTTRVYYNMNDFGQFRAEETEFLKQELKSKAFKKAEERILIHHIPLYGCDDAYQPCVALWKPLLTGQPFFVSINAHMHEYAYYPKGSKLGNTYPVVVGGGPSVKSATVMILSRKGNSMSLIVRNTDGKELLHLTN